MTGRILIADEVATNRIILKVKLANAGYEVLQAADLQELRTMAAEHPPALVLASSTLPGGGARAAWAALRADRRGQPVPVLALCQSEAERLAALTGGCDDALARPLAEPLLMALIRNLLRARTELDELARRQSIARDFGLGEAGAPFGGLVRIGLVAPTREQGLAWRRQLGEHLRARIELLDPAGARASTSHEAYVLAAELTTPGDGAALVSALRSRLEGRGAALVVAADPARPEQAALALDTGADAVVPTSFEPEEVALRLSRLVAQKRALEQMRRHLDQQLDLALRDPLTGLYNRRYVQGYLAELAHTAARQQRPFAVMLLDLDRFKQVNDAHGHATGDEVLVEVARRLRAALRETDLVARLGGEEFLVVMPDTDRHEAEQAAERLRRAIADAPLLAPTRGISLSVTVSIGVAMSNGRGLPRNSADAVRALIDNADQALYAAKAHGRNQVTFLRPAA